MIYEKLKLMDERWLNKQMPPPPEIIILCYVSSAHKWKIFEEYTADEFKSIENKIENMVLRIYPSTWQIKIYKIE